MVDKKTRKQYSINSGWKFKINDVENMELLNYQDDSWEDVQLPHVPKIEPAYVQYPWQGVCCYRYKFYADESFNNKNIVLRFGAAMQIAKVWLNETLLTTHYGGYQEFSIDITKHIFHDRQNVIAVKLDNRDTAICPPGKPIKDLDFTYPGGLYRGASILIQNSLHISDSIMADVEAGGGIFVKYSNVSNECADVETATHVINENDEVCRRVTIVQTLIDAQENVVAENKSVPIIVSSKIGHSVKQIMKVKNPNLWSPDNPYLYTLKTSVFHDGVLCDEVKTRIGIRYLSMNKLLHINGKPIKIIGTNRHQEYPYVGYAVSANAAKRDAVRIKEGGFNLVRLSHYPQDPSFLDACDELGILVQEPIPGWQIIHMTQEFIENSFRDTREMIRRDRNHPCIVFWEPNLNETYGDHKDFCRTQYEIAHKEYPTDQCFTFGDNSPEWDWGGWDVKNYKREYGDWNFGGNDSTSRHLIGEGEEAMLQQAWNFIWTYNYLNKGYNDDVKEYCGCGTWVMFDYNRGYYHKACTCGMMNIFRLPKYIWHFFRSQKDPYIYKPNIFIANAWDKRKSPSKVVVFSNCDEVELRLNSKSIAKQAPDNGPDTPYSRVEEINLATVGESYDKSGGFPFDGGNSKQIAHPPFTFFDVPYEKGTLEAIGYLNGKEVVSHIISTPLNPVRIELELDLCGINPHKNESDILFLRAKLLDENDMTVFTNKGKVKFNAEGCAKIVGDNPVEFEGGIATVLLKTFDDGPVTVSACIIDDESFTAKKRFDFE